jgi:hypothetical protein
MSFCCAGRRALVFAVIAAGMLFRANAELYPALSVATFPPTAETAAETAILSPLDFSLANHYSGAHYLDHSNLPSLLVTLPPQDLFTYSAALELQADRLDPQDAAPAWESLWQGANRISVAAVPEPSTFALLGAGAFLLGARKLRSRQ